MEHNISSTNGRLRLWSQNAASQTNMRGWQQFGGPLLTLGVIIVIQLLSRTPLSLPNPPAIVLIIVVFSAFNGGIRPGLASAIIAWVYFAYYFSNPNQPFSYTDDNARRVVVWLIATPTMALMVGLLKRRAERAFEIAKTNAVLQTKLAERTEANEALQQLNTQLDQRVAERTRDLRIGADVARQITTLLNPQELLQAVVERTKAGFNLYAVSIFLYNGETQSLTLKASAGQAGEIMKMEDWRFNLETDKGLAPEAGRTRAAVLINDVSQDDRHRPNPHLPETRSELALPMAVGNLLVGVLDFQSEQVNHFTETDVQVMTTLADQIAIAVRNAQLFESAQTALQAAERANTVKSAFLASMSHELRTPLNSIINFTRFVVDGDLGSVNKEQGDALNEVFGSAKHLLHLINDVLDMSKIESGALTLFIEDNVNLLDILNKVQTTGKSLLLDKPVALHLNAESNLPSIRCDRQRILQILLNIVSNACKFTKQGQIDIVAYQRDDQVVVAVTDTGPGIPSADQPAVFEAFKQTGSGLRQGGGTGLGMPISKNLAEAHNGRLWLESEPGKGAKFYVSLPVKSKELALALSEAVSK